MTARSGYAYRSLGNLGGFLRMRRFNQLQSKLLIIQSNPRKGFKYTINQGPRINWLIDSKSGPRSFMPQPWRKSGTGRQDPERQRRLVSSDVTALLLQYATNLTPDPFLLGPSLQNNASERIDIYRLSRWAASLPKPGMDEYSKSIMINNAARPPSSSYIYPYRASILEYDLSWDYRQHTR